MKGNLIFHSAKGGEITPMEAFKMGERTLQNVLFHKTTVTTHIALVHEEGHPEPWFIAMDCTPSEAKAFDYGMRGGVEALFSDLKTRGFRVTQTQLKTVDRLEKLVLVLTIALYWATAIGASSAPNHPLKKIQKNRPDLFAPSSHVA